MAGTNGCARYGGEPPDGAAACSRNAMRPRFPEKSRRINLHPVPRPTQVGGYKHTKARERNLVKELGNIAP